jgi:hypothetical protein
VLAVDRLALHLVVDDGVTALRSLILLNLRLDLLRRYVRRSLDAVLVVESILLVFEDLLVIETLLLLLHVVLDGLVLAAVAMLIKELGLLLQLLLLRGDHLGGLLLLRLLGRHGCLELGADLLHLDLDLLNVALHVAQVLHFSLQDLHLF